MDFMEAHCFRCNCEDDEVDGDIRCEILTNTMLYEVEEPGYPKEWTYDARGRCTCTAFKPENACPINARPKPPRQVDGQLTIEQVSGV